MRFEFAPHVFSGWGTVEAFLCPIFSAQCWVCIDGHVNGKAAELRRALARVSSGLSAFGVELQ